MVDGAEEDGFVVLQCGNRFEWIGVLGGERGRGGAYGVGYSLAFGI